MRLIMLAILLLLGLTLLNAFVLRRDLRMTAAENYVGTSGLVQPVPRHDEWKHFAYREVIAVAITAVLYGGVASLGKRR